MCSPPSRLFEKKFFLRNYLGYSYNPICVLSNEFQVAVRTFHQIISSLYLLNKFV